MLSEQTKGILQDAIQIGLNGGNQPCDPAWFVEMFCDVCQTWPNPKALEPMRDVQANREEAEQFVAGCFGYTPDEYKQAAKRATP